MSVLQRAWTWASVSTVGLVGSGLALAQDPGDGTALAADAVSALESVGAAVALIGAAMVTAIAAGIVYRWVVAFLAK